MASSLAGKVVVVTGASSGIGSALAKQAAKEGAKLVLAARRKAELDAVAQDCGGESTAFAFCCDVTKRAEHQALLDAALKHWGRVDCWVNNAGCAENSESRRWAYILGLSLCNAACNSATAQVSVKSSSSNAQCSRASCSTACERHVCETETLLPPQRCTAKASGCPRPCRSSPTTIWT